MKYLKKFEIKSTKEFKKGDLVRYNSNIVPSDNKIYYVDHSGSSSFGNESLLFPYDDLVKYWNGQLEEVDGIGWIDNDIIEKISDEEAASIKYNL
jgi:hypothetical protein